MERRPVAEDAREQTLARWDGTSWSDVGDARGVAVLHVHDDGSGPALYAGGGFQAVDGVSAENIARWDGTSWSALGPGLSDDVMALTTWDDGLGGGPALYAGGSFTTSGAQTMQRVARWDGAGWAPLGNGVNELVKALLVHDDGLGGGPALYAGGFFTGAGGVAASRIARWDGVGWSALGTGLDGMVMSLASFDDGLGARLYAGGSLALAGGTAVSGIARWDGVAWSALGSGVNDFVWALATHDDGHGPALYAGGPFTVAGGVPAQQLARWDGAGWSALGTGGPGQLGSALAFCSSPMGLGAPRLFVGGTFLDLGGSGDSFLGIWQGCPSPQLACPSEVVQGTADASGAVVSFTVTATGSGSPPPTVTCVPPSGSTFPLGTTLVTCTATDAGGSQATCSFPVHVYRKTRAR